MASSTMTEKRLKRKRMLDNKVKLLDFYLSNGRDLLQEILEVYTSPGYLYDVLLQSDYYESLSQTAKESYLFMRTQNTFRELELDQTFDLLKRFTRVTQPPCFWCGCCPVRLVKQENIGENLEIFMSIWNSINKSHFMIDEKYSECVSALLSIGEMLSRMFAFGKSFLESVKRDLLDTRKVPPVDIQLVSSGKDVSIQIGPNNTCIFNVEVFDHLPNKTKTERSDNAADDLVKMILHIDQASTSGFSVAHIEERILRSLSGEQLERINKVLKDKFGVHIVVSRRGCVVLVLRKIQPFLHRLRDKDILGQFLSQLFSLVGFSVEDLSVMSVRVDITEGDTEDQVLFAENQKHKKDTKGLEILLHPRKTMESISEDKKRELILTILSEVQDKDPLEIDEEICIQAHFTTGPPIGTQGSKSEFCIQKYTGNECKNLLSASESVKTPAKTSTFKTLPKGNVTERTWNSGNPQQKYSRCHTEHRQETANDMCTNFIEQKRQKRHKLILNLSLCGIAHIFLIIAVLVIYLMLRSSDQEMKACSGNRSLVFKNDSKLVGDQLVIRNLSLDFNELMIHRKRHEEFVTSLDIGCNSLTFMNFSLLTRFRFLRNLNISNNRIQKAEGLNYLPSLQDMDVSNNKLLKIDDLHRISRSLIRYLNLQNNRISRLHSTDFLYFPFLEILDISHNPIIEIQFSSIGLPYGKPLQDRHCITEFGPTTVFIDCSHTLSEVPRPLNKL